MTTAKIHTWTSSLALFLILAVAVVFINSAQAAPGDCVTTGDRTCTIYTRLNSAGGHTLNLGNYVENVTTEYKTRFKIILNDKQTLANSLNSYIEFKFPEGSVPEIWTKENGIAVAKWQGQGDDVALKGNFKREDSSTIKYFFAPGERMDVGESWFHIEIGDTTKEDGKIANQEAGGKELRLRTSADEPGKYKQINYTITSGSDSSWFASIVKAVLSVPLMIINLIIEVIGLILKVFVSTFITIANGLLVFIINITDTF